MKKIAPNIGFDDATFKSCEISNNALIVYITSWNEKSIKLIFFNTIQFIYKLHSDVSGVYEKNEQNEFIKNALEIYYVKVPENHPFKLYAIMDIEDNCFLEVVAESVEIYKESKRMQ